MDDDDEGLARFSGGLGVDVAKRGGDGDGDDLLEFFCEVNIFDH